jgi:hypothetical protein
MRVLRLAGLARPGEILRRGDQDAARRSELARNEARVREGGDADRDVDAFLDRINERSLSGSSTFRSG